MYIDMPFPSPGWADSRPTVTNVHHPRRLDIIMSVSFSHHHLRTLKRQAVADYALTHTIKLVIVAPKKTISHRSS